MKKVILIFSLIAGSSYGNNCFYDGMGIYRCSNGEVWQSDNMGGIRNIQPAWETDRQRQKNNQGNGTCVGEYGGLRLC